MSISACQPSNASGLRLFSPNERVRITVSVNRNGQPTYHIDFDGKPVISPSPLGLDLDRSGVLSQGLKITSASRNRVDQTNAIVAGKASHARDHYNELVLDLRENNPRSAHRKLQLMFRAYDDGVAFRYRVPAQPGLDPIIIKAELTRFYFPKDYQCWGLNLEKFGTGHEGEFTTIRASSIREYDLFDAPLVCETNKHTTTFAITEADLRDYAGLYLSGRHDGGLGVQATLSPRLDDGVAVRLPAGADMQSPWRVVMIGDHPGRLIESNLIYNLNPSSVIADTSWIQPGKSAWDWWNGGIVSGVDMPGMNDATMERFIDFAAQTGLQYMLIDAGWYTSGPEQFGPGIDITRSVPSIQLPVLVDYASQRNIGLFVWLHWKALDAQMDDALAYYQRLGLKGIKVDFMDRDDQGMVEFYHRLLSKAAEHHLLVDLHGAYHPTGLSRTYPNLLTQEGVMGAEYNKWSNRVTATHNVTLPFTRMLLGPMDYTPGGFRNVTPQQFVAQDKLPFVQTTRGQALAMYVVYESPFACVSDSPDVYAEQDGVDFMSAVPTTWDETRVIAGEIGKYIVVARRKASDWFIGAMTNEQPRALRVPLAFLGEGRFTAMVYRDGDSPTELRKTTKMVSKDDAIDIVLAPSGGSAIHIQP